MKSRTTHSTRTGDATMKYRLYIEDDPSEPGSLEAEQQQISLLRTLAEQPSLLLCGPVLPQKIKVYHNGTSWILEAESTVYMEQP